MGKSVSMTTVCEVPSALQKKYGKYDVELPEEEGYAGSLDIIRDPGFMDVPGNIFHDGD